MGEDKKEEHNKYYWDTERNMDHTATKDVMMSVPEGLEFNKSYPISMLNRKGYPVYTGVLKYFPDALMELSRVSLLGNKQHHPDKPLHWDKKKSTDHLDALARHLLEADKLDNDGVLHLAKVAWRALAALQEKLEKENT
jgi:hypothetical protein